MEVKVEELDALKRRLIIEMPQEIISKRIQFAYKELNKQIKMPGFRPGKIPMHILEKQVPVESFTRMFQELMQEYYEEALKETGIEPLGAPEIQQKDMQEIKKDAPFHFSIIVDIKPSLKIGEYKGLKLERREILVSDNEVEAILQRILEGHGHFEPFEEIYAAQNGDFMTINFKGFLRGQPLEKGDAENYTIRIGEKKMLPGFEDQLIGHKKGESFEIKVNLPQDWNNKLRRVSLPVPGLDHDDEVEVADFKVTVKEIKKLVVPNLDDTIAKSEGMDSVDELRREVKTRQQSYREHQQEIHLKNEIFERLVDETEFVPPESLIKRELKFMIEGMKFQIEESGMNLEDSGFEQEQAEKEWKDKAERNTKGYLILEEIANCEDIHVSESDMENEYKMLAEQTKQSVEEVKQRMLSVPESFEHTKSKLRGQKTLNFIYSNCEIEYVKDQPEKKTKKLGD